jgi:hypothetical protein
VILPERRLLYAGHLAHWFVLALAPDCHKELFHDSHPIRIAIANCVLPASLNSHFLKSRTLWISMAMLAVIGLIGCALLMWRPAIAPIERPTGFDTAQLQHGARVVEAGDARSVIRALAANTWQGGLPLVTPFGTLYSTNITADAQTGIGQWSLPAFERAMRQGIARDGIFLSGFPYVHYRRMSAADIADAYAYLMSGPAVHAPARAEQQEFSNEYSPAGVFPGICCFCMASR